MSEAKLVMVSIDKIDPNPMRRLKRYPNNKERLEGLRDSIGDVGFFEGVHARKAGSRYQLAFGHHRTRACQLNGMDEIPLLVKQYTDEEMLKLLSRENDDVGEGRMEVFQEVWEGAVTFYKDMMEQEEVTDTERTGWIARKLGGGWVRANKFAPGSKSPSRRAVACSKIEWHELDHRAFEGVSSRTAYEMINRAEKLEKQVDRAEERGDITPAKADKLRNATWDTMAEVVSQDADQDLNPGKKLGYREAVAEYAERVENVLEETRSSLVGKPRRKPIDVHADEYRKWVGDVIDELGERHGAFFDAARFAADENNTAAELKQVAAQLLRASKAFERYAERTEKINSRGQSRQVLRSV